MTTESLLYQEKLQHKRTQAGSFFIAALLCCAIGSFLAGSYYLGLNETCEIITDCKINPNTASLASMIRLPGIGPARASAIVKYRENNSTDKAVFENCADLQKVKGIGPKTAESAGPWLCFN